MWPRKVLTQQFVVRTRVWKVVGSNRSSASLVWPLNYKMRAGEGGGVEGGRGGGGGSASLLLPLNYKIRAGEGG